MSIEKKIEELGLRLPEAPRPVAAYVPAVVHEKLVFISGQLPLVEGDLIYKGKVGKDVTLEQAYAAAKVCALNCLSAAKSIVGTLDEIVQVIKVTGFVNSAPGFTKQPQVINGASDLLIALFGEAGRHSRAAVGVSELPLGAPVEVEMILRIGNA